MSRPREKIIRASTRYMILFVIFYWSIFQLNSWEVLNTCPRRPSEQAVVTGVVPSPYPPHAYGWRYTYGWPFYIRGCFLNPMLNFEFHACGCLYIYDRSSCQMGEFFIHGWFYTWHLCIYGWLFYLCVAFVPMVGEHTTVDEPFWPLGLEKDEQRRHARNASTSLCGTFFNLIWTILANDIGTPGGFRTMDR